jgi:hypothetical protein
MKSINLKIFFVFFFACLITSCKNADDAKSSNDLAKKINHLEEKINLIDNHTHPSKESILDISDAGYTTKDCGIGTLVFALKDIKQFGSATKIYVEIGNPTFADITSLNLGLRLFEGEETKKEKMFRIPKDLKRGLWTTVDLVFEKTEPSEVKNIEIYHAECRSIVLKKLLNQ